MSSRADLYFSIRSPYSYLGIRRLEQLLKAQRRQIRLDLRPVLPLAVRKPELFAQRSPMWLRYLELDSRRIAEQYGIPFRIWPRPDPIVQDLETLEIASEQPLIYRLTRLMQYAAEQGAGYNFALHLATLIWDGETDNWDEGAHLSKVARTSGLSLADMDAAVEAHPEKYDRMTGENQAALAAAGHWGVPTLVFQNEPFFGQDRIEAFLWRLTKPRP